VTRLKIDFDEIQKAMEDTLRDSFDYFLDTGTGDVVILSEDIISRAHSVLYEDLDEDMEDYEGIEFDEEIDMADWIEDEVELALDIFLYGSDRYVRIPERQSADGYAAMKEFAAGLEDGELRGALLGILDGKGAFRKFKKALEPYPHERKQWHKFNARLAREEIELWLKSLGIAFSPGRPHLQDFS
jgi:Uncharacterised protein family (UPF0158)